MWWITAAAVPPEIAGLPGWALNGLSVASLVGMIISGLVLGKLWTKSQVDNLIARYEKHLERTVNLYEGRVGEAVAREKEWRETAILWQKTAETLSHGLEPIQQQSETSLAILTAWQTHSARSTKRT